MKESPSVDSFKINLELYKNRTLALADQYHRVSTGHFWGVSEHVLSRIETPSAVASRPAFCTYLQENSWIAKRKGINIYKASLVVLKYLFVLLVIEMYIKVLFILGFN